LNRIDANLQKLECQIDQEVYLMKKWIVVLILYQSVIFAQAPDIFQAVHCEPTKSQLFPELIELVELADSVGVHLTILFTPQWADQITLNPDYLIKVRQWQQNGHEIGAHHHGIAGKASWDGYTNHNPADWPDPADFNGNMERYYDRISPVAGDSLLLTGAFSLEEAGVDWPMGMIYQTQGHWIKEAISQPYSMNYRGQDVYVVNHSLILDKAHADSLIQYYPSAGPDDVVGSVLHVYNFGDSETALRTWFEFVKDKTVKTVRQIMRERGLIHEQVTEIHSVKKQAASFILRPAFPNPFNPETCLSFSIRSSGYVHLTIFDLSGMKVHTLINETLSSGSHKIYWNPEALPSGIYLARLTAGRQTETEKLMFLK